MKGNSVEQRFFTEALMQWHHEDNDRSLPWKQEKDPYRIWLSEIILQQTRALQGLPYYLKFTEAFPIVQNMAGAEDEEAFRLWQGLGYYNRCKNMLATARFIANELGGKFPDSYEGLLALKGIGPYTAAAIASFAFDLPYAVVDGNVYRVLGRYFGIETPYDSTEGKKEFQQLASELLDKERSAAYNQAIMDLGATVCTPQNPNCNDCPLQQHCFAYKKEMIRDLPVKSKKLTVKTRYFHYLLVKTEDKIWVRKRTEKDIWQNLHEPFLVEADRALDREELGKMPVVKQLGTGVEGLQFEGSLKQRLTHQIIETKFFSIEMPQPVELTENDGWWIAYDELKNIAFPKTLVSFFQKKLYF